MIPPASTSAADDSNETLPLHWFAKERVCGPPSERWKEPRPAAHPASLARVWSMEICSPMQAEVVARPKFNRAESACFNSSWKRGKDKKTVEEISLLMSDEPRVKHQRPRDPIASRTI